MSITWVSLRSPWQQRVLGDMCADWLPGRKARLIDRGVPGPGAYRGVPERPGLPGVDYWSRAGSLPTPTGDQLCRKSPRWAKVRTGAALGRLPSFRLRDSRRFSHHSA